MEKNNLVVFGTRPEIIKLAPIIKKIDCVTVHTGQHEELARETLKIFNIKPDYDLELMKKVDGITDFISKAIPRLDKLVKKEKPERIWVQGDTASVFVGALVGFLNQIPVVHIEAGLRSGNVYEPFPEEIIRQQVSRMATYHFCPTELAKENLKKENIKENVFVVGNTIVDALKMVKIPNERALNEDYALVTMHRREVIGEPLKKIFEAFKEISKRIRVVFPCHPNPVIRKLAEEARVDTIEPLNYRDMLHYIRDAKFIMTDSGGIQEEAPSFKVPVFVLRNETERQELIDNNFGILVGWHKETIISYANDIIDGNIEIAKGKNPFGDGKTVNKIKEILNL